ncbi:MAG: hypothetical protein HZA03_10885 [Nitrospinae bacterium]|nr:hypothetical protein [Nitrospinota bacterium]
MDADTLRAALEETLAHCGIEIELRNLADDEHNIRSGLCEVEGRRMLILDKRLSPRTQAAIMADTLKDEDLENIYVSPAVRQYLGMEEE